MFHIKRESESLAIPENSNDAVFQMLFSKTLLRNNTASSVLNGMRQLNLLLLGETGSGKSSAGNSILDRREFQTKSSYRSGTTEVKCSKKSV